MRGFFARGKFSSCWGAYWVTALFANPVATFNNTSWFPLTIGDCIANLNGTRVCVCVCVCVCVRQLQHSIRRTYIGRHKHADANDMHVSDGRQNARTCGTGVATAAGIVAQRRRVRMPLESSLLEAFV